MDGLAGTRLFEGGWWSVDRGWVRVMLLLLGWCSVYRFRCFRLRRTVDQMLGRWTVVVLRWSGCLRTLWRRAVDGVWMLLRWCSVVCLRGAEVLLHLIEEGRFVAAAVMLAGAARRWAVLDVYGWRSVLLHGNTVFFVRHLDLDLNLGLWLWHNIWRWRRIRMGGWHSVDGSGKLQLSYRSRRRWTVGRVEADGGLAAFGICARVDDSERRSGQGEGDRQDRENGAHGSVFVLKVVEFLEENTGEFNYFVIMKSTLLHCTHTIELVHYTCI